MQSPRFEVPEALVMEILSKLPVRSLTRFNCVCKYWCSSFQTPHFISKHHHHNLKNNNLNLFLVLREHNTYQPYFSQLSNQKDKKYIVKQNIHLPFFKDESPSVYGACHGLLCLQNPSSDNGAIWNPSTREFKILPPSSIQPPPYPSPLHHNHTFKQVFFFYGGFGFDSKTDDYKFIRFVTFSYTEEDFSCPYDINQVELYSFRSDSWKEIPYPDYRPTDRSLGNNYIDGICYWLLFEENLILSFDMANEKFSFLSVPEFVVSFPRNCIDLLVFNGSLGVIAYPFERIDTSFDLWITSEGVWIKQFRIESIYGVVYPLGFGKNGELFLTTLNRDTNNEVLLFDSSTQELKKLEINNDQDHFPALYDYVESLIRINGKQEVEEHIIRQSVEDA